jgi:hypothetical protein
LWPQLSVGPLVPLPVNPLLPLSITLAVVAALLLVPAALRTLLLVATALLEMLLLVATPLVAVGHLWLLRLLEIAAPAPKSATHCISTAAPATCTCIHRRCHWCHPPSPRLASRLALRCFAAPF